jgi:hypothetical protein
VTARCGWEVDDIVRQLEDHPGVLGELDAVTRHSPFAADLLFDDGAAAARLVATLREHAPLAMQDAIEELRNEGPRVKVRFREVDPMRLLPVEPDHVSACLLHTDQ